MKIHSLSGAFAGFLVLASVSQAAVVTYVVDSAASSLSLASSFNVPDLGLVDLPPQVPGAEIDSYTGTITGDLAGSTLTFSDPFATTIIASLNLNGPFQPAGAGVDNYGVTIPQSLGGGFIAFRDVAFTIPSGTVVSGSPSTAPVEFVGGQADYDVPALGAPGILPLAGGNSANSSGSAASILLAGTTETLTLPVTISYSESGITSTFTGTIVAHRTIPEPASITFCALGLLGLLRRRR